MIHPLLVGGFPNVLTEIRIRDSVTVYSALEIQVVWVMGQGVWLRLLRSFTCFSNPFFIDREYSRSFGFLGHDHAQVRPSGVSLFNSTNTGWVPTISQAQTGIHEWTHDPWPPEAAV